MNADTFVPAGLDMRMKNFFSLILLLLSVCSVLLRPQGTVASESSACTRLIALGAPAVEIVCALRQGEALVARSSWDSFPPAIRLLPDVGTPFQPNVERMMSLAPDLVLSDGRFGRLKERLAPLGVEVVSVEAYHPDEVLPAVASLSVRLKQEERGAELAEELRSLRGAVKKQLGSLRPEAKLRGVMLTGLGEYYCVAPVSGGTVLEEAGAVNLASGMAQPFPLISKEWLVDMEPDFILVPVKTGEFKASQKIVWESEMKALLPKKGRILFMEEGLTFGLRSFLGMLRLAAELYPDRFSQKEIAQRERVFLERFFPSSGQRGRTCP